MFVLLSQQHRLRPGSSCRCDRGVPSCTRVSVPSRPQRCMERCEMGACLLANLFLLKILADTHRPCLASLPFRHHVTRGIIVHHSGPCTYPSQQVAAHAEELHADLSKGFVVGGLSSGANFATVICQRARTDPDLAGKITGMILQMPTLCCPWVYPERYVTLRLPSCPRVCRCQPSAFVIVRAYEHLLFGLFLNSLFISACRALTCFAIT